MIKELMKNIVAFGNFKLFEDVKKRLSENIIEIDTNITIQKIKEYERKYPNKWILYNKELCKIWIKDKPKKFYGLLPEKLYHVSKKKNLDKIGIKPSSEKSTPFGYYDFSFFYVDMDDVEDGSMPYIEGESHLYEITTNIPGIEWYEGFNEPIDGEYNITTNGFIGPDYIIKLE